MTVMSVREFNANVSKAFARVAAGETLDISNNGKIIAEVRPKRAAPRDDPAFQEKLDRLMRVLEKGIPGLSGPATYEERTER